MDKNAAKHLGLSTRMLDVTWCPLPRRMLELLVRIAERRVPPHDIGRLSGRPRSLQP
jgi:hypothetical protein